MGKREEEDRDGREKRWKERQEWEREIVIGERDRDGREREPEKDMKERQGVREKDKKKDRSGRERDLDL